MSNDNREPETFEARTADAIAKELDVLRFKAEQAGLDLLAYHLAMARAEALAVVENGVSL